MATAESSVQVDPRQRADEIQQLIAESNNPRAIDRLLDFAKDFGSRANLRSAVIFSNRYREVAATIRTIGPSAATTVERNQTLAGVLELVDEILDAAVAPKVVDRPQADQSDPSPAKGAFTANVKGERGPAAGGLVVSARSIGLVRRAEDPRFALEDISIELALGQILAVVGANGNGKSTLLEILAGQLARDSGDLAYPALGNEWAMIKRHIAYIPQKLTKNVDHSEVAMRYTAALYGSVGTDNDLVIDYTLTRLGLRKFRHVPSDELSLGYAVRFRLARALLKRPKLLILDEPLAHLDIPTQARFLTDLRDFSRSPTNTFAVIISSQHLHEIESISDQTLALNDGQPKFYGPSMEVGAGREGELFEIWATCTSDELTRALAPLGNCRVEQTGARILLHLPLGTTSSDFMPLLSNQRITVTYFRDVGNSARSLIQEEV